MTDTIKPNFKGTWFNCPHCKIKTEHNWYELHIVEKIYIPSELQEQLNKYKKEQAYEIETKRILKEELPLHLSLCRHCKKYCIWTEEQLIYPITSSPIIFNEDLPEDILKDCEESASISNLSPRASHILNRRIIQKLLSNYADKGETIYEMAEALKNSGKINQTTHTRITVIRLLGNDIVLHAVF